MQLTPSTRSLAPPLARLLLQTYLLAMAPVAAWMPAFYALARAQGGPL